MKARIGNINFIVKDKIVKCIITFEDPYWNNVKRIVKGVAKCNPDDTFDETLGRRIAEGRAKRAMFQKLDESAWNLKTNLENEMWIQHNRAKRETEQIK